MSPVGCLGCRKLVESWWKVLLCSYFANLVWVLWTLDRAIQGTSISIPTMQLSKLALLVALAHLLEQGALLPTPWVDVKARCFWQEF
eukprot:symbB.v1.2.016762.t1/scaffold1288.1/size126514/3